MAVAERIGPVDEDDVQVPVQLPVLEAVVEEEDLRPEAFDSQTAAGGPMAADEDGNTWQAAGHEAGFIAAFFSRQQDVLPVGHDGSPALFPLGAVAPVEQGYAPALGLQALGQHTRCRRLTRTADSDIAQADDDGRHVFLPFRMRSDGMILGQDAFPIQPGRPAQQGQGRPVPAAMRTTAGEIMEIGRCPVAKRHVLTSRRGQHRASAAAVPGSSASPPGFPGRLRYSCVSWLRPGPDG